MIKLKIEGGDRECAIWLPQITEFSSVSETVVADKIGVDLTGNLNALRRSITLEMSNHIGGMICYGKVAIQLSGNNNTSSSEIEILQMNKNGESEYRLCQKIEPWIDPEYYKGILKGTSDAAKQYKHLSEKIQIYSGAQGEVGSSLKFFYLVSHTAVILLSTEESEFQRVVTDSFNFYNSYQINWS
jgi:hypothetical protein